MPLPDVTCGPDGSDGAAFVAAINGAKDRAESSARLYWFYANDTATNPAAGGTKISHAANATDTYLTNNNLGNRTTSYNPRLKDNVWNPLTNKFDYTSLKIGDIFNIRVDLVIDHAAAQEVILVMDLAEGSTTTTPYTQNVSHDYYVTATNGVTITAFFETPLFSQATLDNPARLRLESKGAATIIVEGFYYKVTSVQVD
jgi:hypothetical protein